MINSMDSVGESHSKARDRSPKRHGHHSKERRNRSRSQSPSSSSSSRRHKRESDRYDRKRSYGNILLAIISKSSGEKPHLFFFFFSFGKTCIYIVGENMQHIWKPQINANQRSVQAKRDQSLVTRVMMAHQNRHLKVRVANKMKRALELI
jgi:hypothetical protein